MVNALGGFTVDHSAVDDFHTAFGRAPDTVWAAPGRVNVIGEHTDYNDGFSLPMALPLRTVAAVARRDDAALHVGSRQRPGEIVTISDAQPGKVTGWAGYVAGIVWALREAGHDAGGLDVLISSDVPEGAGLSSSAALECAVGAAIAELTGWDISADSERATLARLAQRSENEFVGAPTGIMDQTASLRCTDRHALLLDARTLEATQVPFDLRREGLALLVIDSRSPHAHVDGEYAARRRSCEEAARALGVASLRELTEADLRSPAVAALEETSYRRVRHVVTENARVLRTVDLLEDGRVREIGPMLTASHASLRDDYEVSVPRIDAAVDAALDAGAYGARITGGGFGGCVIALADADAVEQLRAAVQRTYAARDFGEPGFFTVVPSAGAHRL
jgi:galactokinase